MTVYLNGDYHDHGPLIDSRDRGFLLADGVFETLMVRSGRAIFLQAHLDRLNEACAELSIRFRGETPAFAEIFDALATQNTLQQGDAAGRITVTRGQAKRGLLFDPGAPPTVLVSVAPMPARQTHWRWHLSTIVRPSFARTSRLKTLGYLDNTLAANAAAADNCEEAVMLNEHGKAVCGSRSTLFVIMDEAKAGVGASVLLTPPVSDGALPGITRATVLSLAKEAGIMVRETSLTPAMLKEGFVFFTNSLHGLVTGADAREHAIFRVLKAGFARACDAEEKRAF